MIINHWVQWGTNHFQTHPLDRVEPTTLVILGVRINSTRTFFTSTWEGSISPPKKKAKSDTRLTSPCCCQNIVFGLWSSMPYKLTQLCNPTAYLNLPPTSFFRPCAKILFFQYPENFSGPTLKFRTLPFWGINGNGNHWVQTCETNIWGIFKPLALIHANKSIPSPNSWQGRIRI